MNCPSRTDDTLAHPGWNQNPPPFSPDITARNDFNGIANARVHRRNDDTGGTVGSDTMSIDSRPLSQEDQDPCTEKAPHGEVIAAASGGKPPSKTSGSPRRLQNFVTESTLHCARSLAKFVRFLGPGFLIAVAYIDPGNYSTDVAAGASFKYALLFVVLLSNLFAMLLQSLCIKLGTVTGLNLAENCREHLPRWMVYILYVFAEAAIVATDIAEVCRYQSLHLYVFFLLIVDPGGGFCHCIEPPGKYPVGGWMCHHSSRCLLFASFLAPEWVHVGTASVRVLRHGTCDGRCHLLLHSTLPYQGPVRWGGLSGLSSVFGRCAIRRVRQVQ